MVQLEWQDVAVRAVAALITTALPVAVWCGCVWRTTNRHHTWRWIGMGAVQFVASQVVHIPLNLLVIMPLLKLLGHDDDGSIETATTNAGSSLFAFAMILALSAGVCEEGTRYLMYRFWWLRRGRQGDDDGSNRSRHDHGCDYQMAVCVGAGHGGCEALLVGLSLTATFIYCTVQRHDDTDQNEIAAYWALPWYTILMAPVERITAMLFHCSAQVLVWQVFLTTTGRQRRDSNNNNWPWLVAAIGFHTWLDTLAVVSSSEKWNPVATEIILAIWTIPLAVWILVALQDHHDTTTNAHWNGYAFMPQDDDDDHDNEQDEQAWLLPPADETPQDAADAAHAWMVPPPHEERTAATSTTEQVDTTMTATTASLPADNDATTTTATTRDDVVETTGTATVAVKAVHELV